MFREVIGGLLARWLRGHGLQPGPVSSESFAMLPWFSDQVFLHIGCGAARQADTTAQFALSSWQEVRFDIDPAAAPDIVGTMLDMSEIPTGAVAGVFSSHNIEHLEAHEVPVALAEFHRVLAEDGVLVLRCPDLQTVARWVAEGHLDQPDFPTAAGPVTPLDMVYGLRSALARGHGFMAHRTGFVLPMLVRLIREAGFRAVHGRRCEAVFELQVVASKSALSEDAIAQQAALHFP